MFSGEDEFKKILSNFDVIIEIGNCEPSLYSLLSNCKKSESKVISYVDEINQSIDYGEKIDFRVGNCCKRNTAEEIKKIINSSNCPILLLCDGKNKILEFYFYSNFLKKGDVIMCHDYAHSKEDFENLKLKLNCNLKYDIWWDFIEPIVKKKNLKQYYYDDFKNIFWGCFIKD